MDVEVNPASAEVVPTVTNTINVTKPLAPKEPLINKSNSKEGKKPRIPLPHEDGPRGEVHPLTVLARKLRAENFLTEAEFSDFERKWRQNSTDLSEVAMLMKAWLDRDREGQRWSQAHQYQCLIPNQQDYPEATQTTFRLDNLQLLLGTEQPEMLAYLTESFRNGFDIAIDSERSTVVYENKKGMSPEEEVALAVGIEEDFRLGYSAKRPVNSKQVFVGNPVYVIPKKKMGKVIRGKWRRVHNVSKSKRGFASVNEGIADEDATLNYPTVELAAHRTLATKASGLQVWYSKWDLKHAYRTLPVRPDQCGLLGFTDQGGRQFVELRVPFGVKSGCRLFTAVSSTVAWILEHVLGCDNVLSYIDDFLAIIPGQRRSDAAASIVSMTFALLGLAVEPEKVEISQEALTFLGVEFDAVTETLAMPQERKAMLMDILHDWSGRKEAPLEEVQSIAGVLCWACKTVPQGGLFLRRIFASIAGAEKFRRRTVALGVEFHKDIKWWLAFLPVWNGKCRMKSFNAAPVEAHIHQYGDASNFAGAAVWNGEFYQHVWGDEAMVMSAKRVHINVRELYALVAGACTWGHHWTGRRVQFHCDNMVSVFSVMRGHSKNKEIMHLLRVLHFVAALNDFEFSIVHVRGVDNGEADAASRQRAEQFAQSSGLRQVAPQLPPSSTCEDWEAQAVRQLLAMKQAN